MTLRLVKKYGVRNLGYYELGDNEGMILVASLRQLTVLMEDYFGIEIVDEYLNEIDDFDYEDGRWVTCGWFNLKESIKSTRKSFKEKKNIILAVIYYDEKSEDYEIDENLGIHEFDSIKSAKEFARSYYGDYYRLGIFENYQLVFIKHQFSKTFTCVR